MTTQQKIEAVKLKWERLIASLIPDIDDDYRAHDDDVPGMCVTVGATVTDDGISWGYQTGDNSYTGGAYGHATWAVVYVYRDSDPADIAEQIAVEIAENLPDDVWED